MSDLLKWIKPKTVNLPDGTYCGQWHGYEITLNDGVNTASVQTRIGLKGWALYNFVIKGKKIIRFYQ